MTYRYLQLCITAFTALTFALCAAVLILEPSTPGRESMGLPRVYVATNAAGPYVETTNFTRRFEHGWIIEIMIMTNTTRYYRVGN